MPYLPRQGVPEGVGGLRVRHDVRRLAQVREQQAGVGQQARGGLRAWGGCGMWAREPPPRPSSALPRHGFVFRGLRCGFVR